MRHAFLTLNPYSTQVPDPVNSWIHFNSIYTCRSRSPPQLCQKKHGIHERTTTAIVYIGSRTQENDRDNHKEVKYDAVGVTCVSTVPDYDLSQLWLGLDMLLLILLSGLKNRKRRSRASSNCHVTYQMLTCYTIPESISSAQRGRKTRYPEARSA